MHGCMYIDIYVPAPARGATSRARPPAPARRRTPSGTSWPARPCPPRPLKDGGEDGVGWWGGRVNYRVRCLGTRRPEARSALTKRPTTLPKGKPTHHEARTRRSRGSAGCPAPGRPGRCRGSGSTPTLGGRRRTPARGTGPSRTASAPVVVREGGRGVVVIYTYIRTLHIGVDQPLQSRTRGSSTHGPPPYC